MLADLGTLGVTAASIGFLHTLCGPDHYLPFVAMSHVGGWGRGKTMVVTFVCGIGHVASSVFLGAIGIAVGTAVLKLETLQKIESQRGDLAGWLLVAFGLTYFVWGVARAIRNLPHTHRHGHGGGHGLRRGSMTPWVLFTIFLFGPCEPLIPLVMYPAAQANLAAVVVVTALFSLTTLATMCTMVALICFGTGPLRLPRVERFSQALAGLVVLSCGVAIKCGL